MNRKNIIIILIVLVLALLVLGATLWFDSNWNRQEISGNESPSWQEPSEEPTSEPEASSQPENNAQEDAQASGNIVAPGFTVYNAKGETVQLSDFVGKPVILNFWASWCGPCKSEMPTFQEMYAEYGDEIHFLMVNLTDGEKETAQSAYDFVTGQGYTFPVYFDTLSEAASAYSIRSIPITFFIDAEGYAIAQATGAIDSATLQKGIDLILPEPVNEETEPNNDNENPDA